MLFVASSTKIVSVPVGAAMSNGISVAASIGALNGAEIGAVVEKPSSVLTASATGLVIFSGTSSVGPVIATTGL